MISQVTSRDIGLSSIRFTDLDETSQDIKTSEANLYGYNIINPDGAAAFVKLYNATAANVTVGTTTPIKTIQVPANSSVLVDVTHLPQIHADTALSVAATTAVGDADTGAPTTDLTADFSYA